MPDLRIRPLNLGVLHTLERSAFLLHRHPGETFDAPCIAWLIHGASSTILVDAGPCDPATAEAQYRRSLSRSPDQELPAALRRGGITPADVDLVILTHLHWDHSYNLEQMTKATILVQKEEVRYAMAPLPTDRRMYGLAFRGFRPGWFGAYDRFELVEGDREVLPGVAVFLLPGHTPGSQGVGVETREGTYLIAGDNVPLAENWAGDEHLRHIPSGLYVDLEAYFRSFDRMEQIARHVLPSHAFRVLEHDLYPC